MICVFACGINTQGGQNASFQPAPDKSLAIHHRTDTSFDEYPYDTVLKGGYFLAFRSDEKEYHLYVRKGKVFHEIASNSRGLPFKNLGYTAADFSDFFVLAQSFGSGNPHHIQLIKKSNGKNLLERSAIWIGANEDEELLAYTTRDKQGRGKIILWDVRNQKRKTFLIPSYLDAAPGNWYLALEDVKVERNRIEINFTLDGKKMTEVLQ